MKIVTVVGARPQFIKAAAVSRAIAHWNYRNDMSVRELIVHTGQHYDYNMSQMFFEDLRIPEPHINLNIGSASHGVQTGRMLESLDHVLQDHKPDLTIVYGDTNSTLAGALASSKLNIAVAHVEAGLRSFNKKMPEEKNRVVTDHLSTFLFCPTRFAINNLSKEGIATTQQPEQERPTIDEPAVILSGDVMYDCLLYYSKLADKKYGFLEKLGLVDGSGQIIPYVLATLHRPENTDSRERLATILTVLSELTSDTKIVLPLHPRTRNLVAKDKDLQSLLEKLNAIDPISYLEMILLQKHCSYICTDSGGIQKEAFLLKKPCVTLRDQTEWVETVKAGWNVIASSNKAVILSACKRALEYNFKPDSPAPFEGTEKYHDDLYGKGNAAETVISCLVQFFG